MTQRFQTERCSLLFGRRESHCFCLAGEGRVSWKVFIFSYLYMYNCLIIFHLVKIEFHKTWTKSRVKIADGCKLELLMFQR